MYKTLINKFLFTVILINVLTIILPNVLRAQKVSYWQQEVNYKIDVRLDDRQHFLRGYEEIKYTNHSPEIITEIYFHLWPNAYKNDSTAFALKQIENRSLDFRKSVAKDRGYIDSILFKIDGQPVIIEYEKDYIDICKLRLKEPLMPGKTIVIATPFRVKIPFNFSRLGHVEQSYQISQWYPKPAVFDQNGWHPMPYLDQAEFYSEYGSFDVSITLPENYTIGATGDLQNKEEQSRLDSLANITSRMEKFPETDSFPSSSKRLKTLRYTQKNIHDFAWFADKRFHVLKGEVELPNTKRKVITYSMFLNNNSKYWKKSLTYIHDAIYYYSLWVGDYAYDQYTAVHGELRSGGGMEYPNVTVIPDVSSNSELEINIVHEAGHSWFYGMLGNNERDNGWMDEGINTYYQQRYIRTRYPDRKMVGTLANKGLGRGLDIAFYPHSYGNNLLYLYVARINEDQPIQTPSAEFTGVNIPAIMYGKTAICLRYLEVYLGQEKFDMAMQVYFDQWKYRHPQPEDMRYIFEEISGEDLTWFFGEQIHTNKKIDFEIKDVSVENGQTMAKVTNLSFPSPVFVSALDKNDSIIESFRSGPYWGTQLFFFDSKNIERIVIDPKGIIPEINQKNNSMRVKGMFRKVEPLRMQLLGSLENRNRTQLFFTPVAGYNHYDGIMPGIAFYNHVFPSRKFEYELVPLYGTRTEKLNGTGRVAYSLYPEKTFQRITFSLNFSGFTEFNIDPVYMMDSLGNNFLLTPRYMLRYRKLAPKIEFELKRPYPRSPYKETLSARTILVEHLEQTYDRVNSLLDIYHEVQYRLTNTRVINPYSVTATVEEGRSDETHYLKFSVEGKYEFTYKKVNKGIDLRVFGGISTAKDVAAGMFSYDGVSDYKYDNAYIERNDPYHKQFYVMEGGFKNQVNLGNTQGLIAANIRIPFPFLLPLGIYGDIASYTEDQNIYDKAVVYNYGIYMPLVKNMAEIYFPLETSTYEINGPNVIQPKYKDRIRFMLNINLLNPFTAIRNTRLF